MDIYLKSILGEAVFSSRPSCVFVQKGKCYCHRTMLGVGIDSRIKYSVRLRQRIMEKEAFPFVHCFTTILFIHEVSLISIRWEHNGQPQKP